MLLNPLNPHVLKEKIPNHSSAMPTSFVDDFSPFSAARLRHFSTTSNFIPFWYSSHTWFDRVLVTCTFSFHLFGLMLNHRKKNRLGYLSSGTIKFMASQFFLLEWIKWSFSGCCERMAIPFSSSLVFAPPVYTPIHKTFFAVSYSLFLLRWWFYYSKKKRCLFTLIY